MSAAARLIVAVAVAALLAGCGEEEAPPRAGEQRTVTRTATSTKRSEIVVRRVNRLTAFTSPSANIGCYIDKRSVRCDIRRRAWAPPPKPASCENDYGQGIALDAGARPSFVCAGDTALGGADNRIAYGEGIQAGLLRCLSRRSGITCRDTESGRGFLIARERYELL